MQTLTMPHLAKPKQNSNMIQISKLPLITSAKQFFNTDKIVFVDVLLVDDAPLFIKDKLLLLHGAFECNGKLYLPVVMKGSPENMFLTVKNGVESAVCDGFSFIYFFDGKLREAIEAKKVYDFTKHYKPDFIEFAREYVFLAERYIQPYLQTSK